MRLLATLSLLKGLSYVNAATSAFLIAAFTWAQRPVLAGLALAFFAGALGCAMIYQRIVRKSLLLFFEVLLTNKGHNPDIARSAARVLYLEGRDAEARQILLKHVGDSPFVD